MSHLIIFVTLSHEEAGEALSRQFLKRPESALCEGNHFFLSEMDHRRLTFTSVLSLSFLMYRLQLQIPNIKFCHAMIRYSKEYVLVNQVKKSSIFDKKKCRKEFVKMLQEFVRLVYESDGRGGTTV